MVVLSSLDWMDLDATTLDVTVVLSSQLLDSGIVVLDKPGILPSRQES